ncbi:uncharacterized protein LOC111887474 [Lactuca sativa]|uniref:uncharacterized protein LOC111887474 n=1 Tax=Lactuca sativa TaxID=4236 RepID=UPI000CD8FA1D|nr:uncharacterized protein LOC111887474 [Lactuca sativa]
MVTTLKTVVGAAKNAETQIRKNGLGKDKTGEKRKIEVSSRSDKKGRFTKSNLDDQKYGGSGGTKWCEKCQKKHCGRCDGEVTCYKCRRAGHYSGDCTFNKKKCYECGDGGYISKNCPKKNEAARQNEPSKPKARAFQMVLDEVGDTARERE